MGYVRCDTGNDRLMMARKIRYAIHRIAAKRIKRTASVNAVLLFTGTL
jgi:hypothetical protein